MADIEGELAGLRKEKARAAEWLMEEIATRKKAKELHAEGLLPETMLREWPDGICFEDAETTDATGVVRMSGGSAMMGVRSMMGNSFR